MLKQLFRNTNSERRHRTVPCLSADIDSHSGGIWKAASSIAGLLSKDTKTGTFNWDLSIRIGG